MGERERERDRQRDTEEGGFYPNKLIRENTRGGVLKGREKGKVTWKT